LRARIGGLGARSLVVSVVVALLVLAVLLALLFAVAGANRSLDRQSHAKEMSVAAAQVEGSVADVDAALRAYLLTRSGRFGTEFRRGRGHLRAATRRLVGLAADERERNATATIRDDITSYLVNWALPLLFISKQSPAAAASSTAQVEDKREVDVIRSAIFNLMSYEDARAAASARAVHRNATLEIAVGIAVLATTVLAILLFGAYLVAAVARPLRRTAAAAGEVAAGDFSARLSEHGPSEVADLARAFNAMARSLDDSRRQLLHQNQLLKDAERHKSELISMVSHEVRTPLASLLGFTDLLLHRELDAETRRRYLEILHQQSRRLASLTTDFLDARLLEEGRLELGLSEVDLVEIAREQAQVFVAGSDKHPLVLDLPSRPLHVRADRDRLSQVVGNLVANAVKYSPDGGEVQIRVFDDGGRAALEVTDHGVGIPLEDQPLIFTKFYRGHAAGSGIPGTGLGLAIAHELAHAHGGSLAFDSEVGRGTTFRLELPTIGDGDGSRARPFVESARPGA
jgi:signal transduction histidine kinase